jgi:uncharacterized protein (DUF1330 family)
MSCYFLALIGIHDPDRYERYLAGYDAVFEKFEGRILSVEDSPTVLEGDWPAGRTVLIEFPNEEELLRWYRSQEYRGLAVHRTEASVCRVAILKGR